MECSSTISLVKLELQEVGMKRRKDPKGPGDADLEASPVPVTIVRTSFAAQR